MSQPSDCIQYIDHRSTHSFSALVLDYLDQLPELKPFYAHVPELEGIRNAISEKQNQPIDRRTLVDVLKEQYRHLPQVDQVSGNIEALLEQNTFTICTAHQPNLLTGPLYFIYKILHTVKLADYLSAELDGFRFVPVYYIGSEDNDLEELGHFFFYGRNYEWKTGQEGAVGRMKTNDLGPLLNELFARMGPEGSAKEQLIEMIEQSYGQETTIAAATQRFIHELLGRFGIVVLDPDHPRLKTSIQDMIQDDIFHHTAEGLVDKTSEVLNRHYAAQAFVRPVNFFYLKDDIRERIVRENETFTVNHTEIRFSKEEMLQEIKNYPGRFSPNVILRGIYQERILPNIAFVGGGAEIAYWMQLKDVFRHYQTPFPVLILRQSILWINRKTQELMRKSNMLLKNVFLPVDDVLKAEALSRNGTLQIDAESEQIQTVLSALIRKAAGIAPSLEYSARAVQSKIGDQLHILNKKMIREEKRKYEVLKDRLAQIKAHLYPNGSMQERKVSFMDIYLSLGAGMFDYIYQSILPFGDRFAVITEPEKDTGNP